MRPLHQLPLVLGASLALACQPAPETEALATATAGHASKNAEHASEKTVTGGEPYHGLLEYRAKDAKLALVRPTFVNAQKAGLASGVSVVGVSVGGVHRAYPLYVLKNHQIVNDRLGGVPIAASW